jgi:putative MATE family efflux protein
MKEKKYGLDLTTGRISTLLLRFAWPFLAAGIISALYGIVDLFVIGRYCDGTVISGVSTGTQVMNIVYTATIGIGTGGTVLIGRKLGEKDDEGCAKSTGTFLTIGLGLAIFLTAIIFIFREPLLSALQTPPEARSSASMYVLLCTIGVPFNVGYSIMSSIARGLGNSTTPSIVGGIGCAVNIVLDFVFVGKLHMAEAGVALATSIAQLVTLVLIGLWLLRRRFPYPFHKSDFRPDKGAVRNVFRVGIPLWMQELLVSISFMIITAVVNRMGWVASASVGIISKVFSVGGMFPQAVGSAIAAVAAQNLGAGKRDRAFKALKWGIIYSLIFDALFCVACQIAPETITAMFAKEDAAVMLGAASYLRSFSIDLLFVAFVFCANSYLSGLGKASVSMIHSVAATVGLRIPLSVLIAFMKNLELNTQLYYLGFAAPIASILSIVVCVVYIRRANKQLEVSLPAGES